MNAILVMHKNEFDISYINQNLVKVLPVDLRITLESNYNSNLNGRFIEPGNVTCNSLNPLTRSGGRFTGSNYYAYNYDFSEYSIKNAQPGKYRIKVNAYDDYSYPSQVPVFVRVVAFKNFQKANMTMEVKIFDLDNQYGVVELDEVKW